MEDKTITSCTLSLKGLHCASCVNRVETSLNKREGVISANVNLANQKAYVEYDKEMITTDDLKNAIIEAGYEVIELEGKKKLQT